MLHLAIPGIGLAEFSTLGAPVDLDVDAQGWRPVVAGQAALVWHARGYSLRLPAACPRFLYAVSLSLRIHLRPGRDAGGGKALDADWEDEEGRPPSSPPPVAQPSGRFYRHAAGSCLFFLPWPSGRILIRSPIPTLPALGIREALFSRSFRATAMHSP